MSVASLEAMLNPNGDPNKPQLKGISNDLLNDILGKSRGRNQYGPYALKFLESDEPAINVAETWPIFAKKKPATLMQGFRTAVEKANLVDVVQVKLYNENVFLLHKERVEIFQQEQLDTDDIEN